MYPSPLTSDFFHPEIESPDLSDILRFYGDSYQEEHRLSSQQHKALKAIKACQTEELGCHVNVCGDCGYAEGAFNSCRNRHCPRCMWSSQRRWLEARESELLDVPYYHVVFTLPHYFFSFGLFNQKFLYETLMSASSETLKQFAQDPRHLGGHSGFFGVLHTWGQTLWFHPHVHYVVIGGGLSEDGERWVEGKRGEKFIYPVRALSEVFRGKFIEKLKTAYFRGELVFPYDLAMCLDERGFELWLDGAVSQKWVVYAKRPFGGAEKVLKYLSQYTHRTAISNSRLLSLKEGKVRFAYKDYRDKTTPKQIMELPVHDFIQRFLFHVLPSGFHRIRYYGFLANGKRKQNIERIRDLLPLRVAPKNNLEEPVKQPPLACPICSCHSFKFTTYVFEPQTLSWIRSILPWRKSQGDGL